MRRVPLSVDVDANGNGIASVDIFGIVMGVMRVYNGQTSTVDGVLFEQYAKGDQAVERTLLTVSNSNADGYSPVMVNAVDSANAAVSGAYVYPTVAGEVKLRVTGGSVKLAGVVWYLTVKDDYPAGR